MIQYKDCSWGYCVMVLIPSNDSSWDDTFDNIEFYEPSFKPHEKAINILMKDVHIFLKFNSILYFNNRAPFVISRVY